ncbi:hypothetical protein ADICYQ_5202 [Cyclobacterium qasimii M12-11B]|uniref:Uncharacterized protein n=1 Tax=Cyclobacterium qasimii M12-11B TaxID=641524 RepID=S7WGG1_9BACT|nr:hypothetical protein ADICYQ_5202 [Cyclobacterium qasimii M12-11B]
MKASDSFTKFLNEIPDEDEETFVNKAFGSSCLHEKMLANKKDVSEI